MRTGKRRKRKKPNPDHGQQKHVLLSSCLFSRKERHLSKTTYTTTTPLPSPSSPLQLWWFKRIVVTHKQHTTTYNNIQQEKQQETNNHRKQQQQQHRIEIYKPLSFIYPSSGVVIQVEINSTLL